MYIGNTLFRSPYLEEGGDPNCFDPDWLHRAAAHLAATVQVSRRGVPKLPKNLPKRLKANPEFKAHIQHILAVQTGNFSEQQLYEKYPLHAKLVEWANEQYFGQFAMHLKPLLLSPAPMAAIAEDTRVPEATLKAFCQFYYDVREEPAYDVVRGELMRKLVALEGQLELAQNATPAQRWLADAAQPMGYVSLCAQWGMGMSHHVNQADTFRELSKLVQAQLASRLISGRISDEDSIDLLGKIQDQEKFESDVGRAAGADAAWELFQTVMELAKPRLLPQTADKKKEAAQNEALQSRLSAEHTIEATAVEDAGIGAGINEVNDRLRSQAQAGKAAGKEGEKK